MEFELYDILNKNLIIVGIISLLITFGLSGCTQQFSTQKETEDNFTVENQPPEIQHCYYSNDIDNSLRVNLLGFANDNDGEIVSYYWNLSDGFSYSEQLPSHTFQTEGTYYATLTVTDNDGATDSDTISIIVTTQSEEEEEEPEEEWNPEYGVNYEVTITNIVDGDTFDAIFPDGLDYSNLKDDEYQNASKEIGDFITKLGEDNLLVLTNVSGNFFSLDSMKGSRKTGEMIKLHIKKNAIIGCTKTQEIFIKAFSISSGLVTKPFDNIDDAKDWLIE